MTEEQFDINRCIVGGAIQKIWDRESDIFLRLAFLPDPDKPLRYLTLRLPDGKIDGKLVSLQPGEKIRVSGYLVDAPYTETLAEFLRDARKDGLIDRLDNAEKFRQVRVKRVGTRLDVLELERLTNAAELQAADVMVQGIAAKLWNSSRNLKVRLAIYDQYTDILTPGTNGKRPRRKAHYLTAFFPDSKVGGKDVKIHKRNRIRLAGSLQIHFYRQTLREVLLRSGNATLIGELDAVIDPDQIFAIQDSVSMRVDSAIVLASMGRAQLHKSV